MRWTAGFAHIPPFIAGATTTGPANESSERAQQVVGQPAGRLGQEVGRGRGDAEQLGRSASSMWGSGCPAREDLGAHRPAGEGLERLRRRPARVAERVMTTDTPAPACTSRLTRAAVL